MSTPYASALSQPKRCRTLMTSSRVGFMDDLRSMRCCSRSFIAAGKSNYVRQPRAGRKRGSKRTHTHIACVTTDSSTKPQRYGKGTLPSIPSYVIG